jgi:hypothetical protein
VRKLAASICTKALERLTDIDRPGPDREAAANRPGRGIACASGVLIATPAAPALVWSSLVWSSLRAAIPSSGEWHAVAYLAR